MSKTSFMKGAVILGTAGIVVKILGAFFRIPLANIIGDTGMAYYQTAYPVYVLLLAVSTAGIPTAIARLVSEKTAEGNHREAYRIFRLSFGLLAGIGLAGSLVLLLGAPFFAGFSSGEAVYAIRAISPALLMISMMAAFRGYFQGLQDMMPTAVSQITEQFFRVVSGLALSILLVPYGLQYAAAGASFGAAAGGFFGLIVILVIYIRRRAALLSAANQTSSEAIRERSASILKKIAVIAVPITIGVSIMPVMSMIDLLIVPSRLVSAGFSAQQANSLYGQLSGFAASLINLPQILTQSIALSLVPAIASAHQICDAEGLKKEAETGLRMAMIIGFPCAAGLFALAEPVMLLLFPAQKESAVSAAGILAVLAAGVIFLSSVQTLTGILQGVGRQMVPVVNLAIGAVLKVVLTYLLTGLPALNVKGAAAGTVCAYLAASVLNLRAAQSYTGARFDLFLTFFKPGLASVIMGMAVWLTYRGVFSLAGNMAAVGVAVLAGMIVYLIQVFLFHIITREELERIPAGKWMMQKIRKAVQK